MNPAVSDELFFKCRICLDRGTNFTNMRSELRKVYELLMEIALSTEEETLPTTLCPNCENELNQIRQFREKCLSAHKVLVNELQQQANEPLSSTNEVKLGLNESDKDQDIDEEHEIKFSTKTKERVVFKCSKANCNRYFVKRERLDAHMRTHAGLKAEICSFCGKNLANFKSLKRHLQTHLEKVEPKFICDYCQHTFADKTILKAHLNRHTKACKYICHICGKTFFCLTGLHTHQSRHSDRRFVCDECPRSYKSNAELKDHKIRHLGIRNWICTTCGRRFLVQKDLKTHERAVHNAVLKYECTTCGKMFSKPCNLTLHKRLHTGERPFICSECNKSFRQKASLVKHTYSHTGVKPFRCKFCPKAYTEIFILKRHVRQQHPEQP